MSEVKKTKASTGLAAIKNMVFEAFELGKSTPSEMRDKICLELIQKTFQIEDPEVGSVNNSTGFRHYSIQELNNLLVGSYFEHEEKGFGVIEKMPNGRRGMIWQDESVSNFVAEESPWDKKMRVVNLKNKKF
jgi:hypothetical protein